MVFSASAEACNDLMAYSLILSCCCYTCCIRRKLRKMLNITVMLPSFGIKITSCALIYVRCTCRYSDKAFFGSIAYWMIKNVAILLWAIQSKRCCEHVLAAGWLLSDNISSVFCIITFYFFFSCGNLYQIRFISEWILIVKFVSRVKNINVFAMWVFFGIQYYINLF